MPTFMVDITFSDTSLREDHPLRKVLRAVYPDASIENWDSPTGKHFWRVLGHEAAPSFVECLGVTSERVKAAREMLKLSEDESLGVQIALRDARYDVYETIPASWPKSGAEKRQGRTSSRHVGGGALSVAALALALGEAPLPV